MSDFIKTKIKPKVIFHSKIVDGPLKWAAHKKNEENVAPQIKKFNNKQVLISDNHPVFKYHLVSLENNNKNKKPIVGLYLPHINKK